MNNYTHEQKKRLARKIGKLKNKEDYVEIFKIIRSDNKEFTENSNGIFLHFDKLNDITYKLIDQYLKKINKSEPTSDSYEYVPYSTDDSNMFDQPKLKLSNKEKSLIKRKQYVDENSNIYFDFNKQ